MDKYEIVKALDCREGIPRLEVSFADTLSIAKYLTEYAAMKTFCCMITDSVSRETENGREFLEQYYFFKQEYLFRIVEKAIENTRHSEIIEGGRCLHHYILAEDPPYHRVHLSYNSGLIKINLNLEKGIVAHIMNAEKTLGF
ncbi:hypothetical protein ACFL96_04215 [Thermoproteota archaeon]